MEGSYLSIAYNLSGALEAAQSGRFIVLVDVIDMSTTLEAVREAGAVGYWGAAPVHRMSSRTNPFLIGQAAAQEAREKGAGIEVIAEPRGGTEEERREQAGQAISGIESLGFKISRVWPNLGADTARMTDWKGKVAVAVTAAGGTIFDAVWQVGGRLTTATVARTWGMKGPEPAFRGIRRAMDMAGGSPITLVAASSNALEDVLAVNYLAQSILSGNLD